MQNSATRAKIAMLERGLKPADVAVGTGLTLGYVYNVLSGRIVTRTGRKKVEQFLGTAIWHEAETAQAANPSKDFPTTTETKTQ